MKVLKLHRIEKLVIAIVVAPILMFLVQTRVCFLHRVWLTKGSALPAATSKSEVFYQCGTRNSCPKAGLTGADSMFSIWFCPLCRANLEKYEF